MTTTTIAEPRAWIGCLACYNSGRLVGRWYPVTDCDEVDLASVHRGSGVHWKRAGCEELWVMDTDGLPVDTEMSPHDAAAWGEVFTEAGEQWPAVAAWVRSGAYVAEGNSDLPSLSDFEDRYKGAWPSFRDYAVELAEDLCLFEGLSEDSDLVTYFDWDSWIRDLGLGYTVVDAPEYAVYVFSDN
ncbi:MAG: antirestriction protein ArdA [Gordonia sp. (in: high G+C Gram-positive bacteria)]|uniref:antirestriction protein ArdA n=1 Tax=Gordonia sp. (in: high G+C Gram-positive bacteria) TaxID=84139 RepID=UPI0039E2F850